jgi:mono/diheme cytochrome c family protein
VTAAANRWQCLRVSFTIRREHMKRGSALLMVVVAFMGLLAAVAASLVHNGLSARARPSAMEEMLARNAWHLAIPSSARNMHNPMPASEGNMKDARLHFADHCAICHANDGSGDALFARGLYPKPPDLRQAATQNRSDGELFWIIENGVRFTGMPSFASHGMSDDSWKLVHFIRHLPQLTAEERIEMSRYNPKSPADREEEKEEDEFLNGTTPQKSGTSNTHP